MSERLRFHLAAGLILTALWASPASANPFTAFFNPAPEQAAEPAPAKEECLSQPGKSADGQHWVYRLDGHRKCWFLVAEETAAKRPVRRSAAKRRVYADDENKVAPPHRKAVEDARAELWRQAPAETPQPAPQAPAVKAVDVADAAPVPASGAAALIPPPPVLSKADQPKPEDSNPRRSNLESLIAATPADSEATSVSVPVATPVAVPAVETRDERQWWTSPWIGPLLMALGALVLLLIPIWSRRRATLLAEEEAEAEDRPGPHGQEFGRGMHPRDRHDPRATSRPASLRARGTIEDQRKPRPSVQRREDVSFQEAIKMLTDFDTTSADGSAALPSRGV